MRTTLTLDDDVTALLERMRKERDLDLKEIVNDALRRGLAKMDAPKTREPFHVRTFDVGKPLHPIDSIADALAFAEGEDQQVILIDANLLLYAYVPSYAEHPRACQWLEQQFNGATLVGIPWPSLLAFVRLIANPKIYPQSISVTEAWDQVRIWLARDNVWIPLPTDRHTDILNGLMPTAALKPKLVPDAHLAALAIEHGLTLCTNDMDFGRFPKLKWINPLLP